MTSREQFELVWKGSEISDDDTLKQIAWAFWRASRDAVEIELPSVTDAADWLVSVDVMESEHVISAIRAAGIKVKGE